MKKTSCFKILELKKSKFINRSKTRMEVEMFVAILKETLITEDEGQGAFNWLYFHFKTFPL